MKIFPSWFFRLSSELQITIFCVFFVLFPVAGINFVMENIACGYLCQLNERYDSSIEIKKLELETEYRLSEIERNRIFCESFSGRIRSEIPVRCLSHFDIK